MLEGSDRQPPLFYARKVDPERERGLWFRVWKSSESAHDKPWRCCKMIQLCRDTVKTAAT